MNGSRSSSTSGSYGHLSAGQFSNNFVFILLFVSIFIIFNVLFLLVFTRIGALSPAMGLPPLPAAHLQQLQAHLIRTGSLGGSLGASLGGHGSPFLTHPGMLHHQAAMQSHQHQHNLFQLSGSGHGLSHHPPSMAGLMHSHHPMSGIHVKPEVNI